MDLDAYVLAHSHEWSRLEALLRSGPVDGPRSDELLESYQRVATHLSVVRSSAPDAQLVAYLSSLLGRARLRTTGTRTSSWRSVGRFFTHRFPAALYRLRRWWLGCLVANLVVAVALGWWFLEHPAVQQTLLSRAEVNQLVNSDFESYYSEFAAGSFAARVWTNNAWVAALCIALGVLGLPIVYILWQNVLNLAIVGSIMIRADRADLFFGLILPHGMLELTAVFVAAGVGLRLFFSWVVPGDLTRVASMAREGRTAVTVAIGLVVVLFVSGVIEAFVTPSGLPTWARIGIGALAEVLFFAYVFVLGRRAALEGEDGDLALTLREDVVATQA